MGLDSLLSIHGGKGKFVNGLGGAPGIKALVIGGGTVGRACVSVLHALGAWVTVMDINIGTLRDIGKQFNEEVNTQISNRYNLKKLLPEIDVVYNCVRWPKDATEFMIDREMVRSMEKGSVIVDISNDVGAIETFHETTHDDPRYIEEGVVHSLCQPTSPAPLPVHLPSPTRPPCCPISAPSSTTGWPPPVPRTASSAAASPPIRAI